jgi:glutaredoxin
MKVFLYTQPMCPYCDIMKEMLNEAGVEYETYDIKERPAAKEFLYYEGHKTVPQLYVGSTHINKKPNTRDYTAEELKTLIDEEKASVWPWQDSGIEGSL